MFNFLLENYRRFSKANKYIIGFIYGGNVYYIVTKDIDKYAKLDTTPNKGYSIRVYLNDSLKIEMLKQNPQYLCKANHFYKLLNNSKYNKGDIFEALVLKKHYKKWTKNNEPFFKTGDMKYKGEQYQIKFERATFTNEKQIKRLIAAGE